jgi:hypothetical protein
MDSKATAGKLRKIAKMIREKHENKDKERTTKCAQVLVAAQGLNKLAQVLRGEAS